MALPLTSAMMAVATALALARAPAPAATPASAPVPGGSSLEALVAEAWSTSPEVARAAADVAAAEAEVARHGVILPNPQLQLGGRTDAVFQAEGELNGDIGLVQALVWPGARLARRDGAAQSASAARLRLALARLEVAARLEAAVAAFKAAHDGLALRADMARLAQALAEAASRRAAAGAASSVEAALARADEALALSAWADARGLVAMERAALCARLGRAQCDDLDKTVAWPSLSSLPSPPSPAARADVDAAARDVAAARLEVKGAEADRVPAAQVGLGLTVERTALYAQGTATPLVDFDQIAGMTLAVELPAWDWKVGEIARARAGVARAEAALLEQRRHAELSVRRALARLAAATEAEDRLAAVDEPVAAALLDLERASVGGALPLDQALAMRDRLLRTRFERVEARRRRVEAHAAALEAFADPRLVGIEVTP